MLPYALQLQVWVNQSYQLFFSCRKLMKQLQLFVKQIAAVHVFMEM